jgi:hypothetical protein
MMDVGDKIKDSFIWSEQLGQLGHRIAHERDLAFQSSLLLLESGDDESHEASPFMLRTAGNVTAITCVGGKIEPSQ